MEGRTENWKFWVWIEMPPSCDWSTNLRYKQTIIKSFRLDIIVTMIYYMHFAKRLELKTGTVFSKINICKSGTPLSANNYAESTCQGPLTACANLGFIHSTANY